MASHDDLVAPACSRQTRKGNDEGWIMTTFAWCKASLVRLWYCQIAWSYLRSTRTLALSCPHVL